LRQHEVRGQTPEKLGNFAKFALHNCQRWETVYERLHKRRGKKKAIVAVARRLLGVMVALLRSGQAYRLAG